MLQGIHTAEGQMDSPKGAEREKCKIWTKKQIIRAVCLFLFWTVLLTIVSFLASKAEANTVYAYNTQENCFQDAEDAESGARASRYDQTYTDEITFHVIGNETVYSLRGKCYAVNQTMRTISQFHATVNYVVMEASVSVSASIVGKILAGLKSEFQGLVAWVAARLANSGIGAINNYPTVTDVMIDAAQLSAVQMAKDPCLAIVHASITGFPIGVSGTTVYRLSKRISSKN